MSQCTPSTTRIKTNRRRLERFLQIVCRQGKCILEWGARASILWMENEDSSHWLYFYFKEARKGNFVRFPLRNWKKHHEGNGILRILLLSTLLVTGTNICVSGSQTIIRLTSGQRPRIENNCILCKEMHNRQVETFLLLASCSFQ
jgi:hypothetical protein